MRASSRVTNFLVRRARPLYRNFWSVHRWLYCRTGGRRFNSIVGSPLLLLTVPGRRTGRRRSVLVVYGRHGQGLVVCASHAGHPSTPDWYRNLMAAGEAEVFLEGRTRRMKARELAGDERARCWEVMVDAFPHDADYQSLTTRTFPIAMLEPSG